MRLSVLCPLLFVLAAVLFVAQPSKTLEIYVIDVEGGKATLVVSPSKESLLIDTGNIAGSGRDAERIMAAIHDAGLQQIDHLITTHWHRDHMGAMALVAGRIPIREFIDHGTNVQPDKPVDAFLQHTYPRLYADSKHTVVKPGSRIAVADLDVHIVASAGETIKTPLLGAGMPNPYCDAFKQPAVDRTENSQSIGLHIALGKFRALDLGDLSADKEFDLMCPNNPVGTVDLFMVSHHGQPNSNTKVLVHAIESRVAIMNNGIRKGGQPHVMKVIHTAPGLEDLWQLHFSLLSGQEYTVPGLFIANVPDKPQSWIPVAPMPAPRARESNPGAPVHNGAASWIKVSAHQNGSFEITNGRNGFSKTYRARTN
jgi:competence protein ComEC